MEELKETRKSKTSASFSKSKEHPMEPWHSTPVKKSLFAAVEAPDVSSCELRDESRARLQDPSTPASFSITHDFQGAGTGSSTVQRQRLELQLLMAELKEREQELNTMAAAHHKHLLSWEQERQRVLILEQRCARLEDELEKRTELIRALSKRVKVVEARERDAVRALDGAREQLQELSRRQTNTSRHEQELEEKNQSLNATVLLLSSQVGQLQVREEELASMLKLKDTDVLKATSHILELSGRLCELEKCLEELQTRESQTLRETEEHRHRLRESRFENTQLRAELQEKTAENNGQREELIRLKQENLMMMRREMEAVELHTRNEENSWRDELLELSRSKQSRTESEVKCLRQVCEIQQNDLQVLKLNLDSAREALRHHEGQRSRQRADSGLGASCELENSDHQELETGLMSTCSASAYGASVLAQPCGDVETQSAAEPGDAVGCEDPHRTSAHLDLMAVFDYDPETGTPVCVVDISPSVSCAVELSRLHLDDSSPSCGSRRSSVCLHDSALSIEQCGKEVDRSSSTSRLQRLLAQSQEMVESLENTAKKSISPANCDADVQSNHSDGSHAHTSTHHQEGGECDSHIHSCSHVQQGSK